MGECCAEPAGPPGVTTEGTGSASHFPVRSCRRPCAAAAVAANALAQPAPHAHVPRPAPPVGDRWRRPEVQRSSKIPKGFRGRSGLRPNARPDSSLFRGDFGSRTIYLQELVDRAVRLALESWRPVAHVADELGSLARRCERRFLARRPIKACARICPPSEEHQEIKHLRKEKFELRLANEILKAASFVFRDRARHRPHEVTRLSTGIASTSVSSRSAGY